LIELNVEICGLKVHIFHRLQRGSECLAYGFFLGGFDITRSSLCADEYIEYSAGDFSHATTCESKAVHVRPKAHGYAGATGKAAKSAIAGFSRSFWEMGVGVNSR
jgi:hypothetical protein